MTNEPTNLDTHDHTLEGELRDFPARFPDRASWDRYCEEQANREDIFTREVDSPDDEPEEGDWEPNGDPAGDPDDFPYGWDVEHEEFPW